MNKRCDIYTNFDFLNENLYNYGYYRENYIETKYFDNRNRQKGNQTKSENAGYIICDIYRLMEGCKDKKDRGLYSLIVFDYDLSKYLGFSRADGNSRNWVVELFFKTGVNNLYFNLKETNFNSINSNLGYYGSLIQILD